MEQELSLEREGAEGVGVGVGATDLQEGGPARGWDTGITGLIPHRQPQLQQGPWAHSLGRRAFCPAADTGAVAPDLIVNPASPRQGFPTSVPLTF